MIFIVDSGFFEYNWQVALLPKSLTKPHQLIVLHKILFATALLLLTVCVNSTAKAQTVTFNTNVGDIVVELFPDEAPISVDNFLGYIERGDYEGTFFHRSVTDFVIQGGLASKRQRRSRPK